MSLKSQYLYRVFVYLFLLVFLYVLYYGPILCETNRLKENGVFRFRPNED
jgi:hypothetical protein